MNTQSINETLNILIKVVVLFAMAFTLTTAIQLNDKYSHTGPKCSAVNMQHWIDKTPVKGKIVSIHEDKLQVKDGTTTCSGVFESNVGAFLGWSGSITELSDGRVIGWAKVD